MPRHLAPRPKEFEEPFEIVEHLVALPGGRYGWRVSLPAMMAYWSELARDVVLPPARTPTVLVRAKRTTPPYVTDELIDGLAQRLGSDFRLLDFDCKYVIVGHSERRSLYGESDELVASKYMAAQAAGLTPILCVGESLDERESGVTEAVVARQLDAVIKVAGVASLAKAVVAYEPVWAIGTGKTATPAQAQAVHAYIRGKVAALDAGVAAQLIIQYGGSVKAANAAELMAQPDIDGGLIGGASLVADEFIAICRAAAK